MKREQRVGERFKGAFSPDASRVLTLVKVRDEVDVVDAAPCLV